jgi:hypothetical protein
MINELLEKRDILSDIAIELYGEWWITNDKFWNSPTELELRKVESQLFDLGYDISDKLTPDQILLVNLLIKKIKGQGNE